MLSIQEMSVTIACGSRTRAVAPEALARQLGLATVRPALFALLLGPVDPQPVPIGSSPSGEPTEGERSFAPNVGTNGTNVDVPQKYILGNVSERSLPEGQEDFPESADALAKKLADALNDPGSLAWFRQVAETLDPLLVRHALVRALNVPPDRLRRSRAAYFTSIVAPLVRRSRLTQPYASTPSPT